MRDFLMTHGLIPDSLIRFVIRRRLRSKLRDEEKYPDIVTRKKVLFKKLDDSPIAVHTDAANQQHYELPPEFFRAILGKHLKYSCGDWSGSAQDLDESERQMLDLYVERARIEDGQKVLELGCGWGSLSLYLAERFPASQILAVSNSAPQREFIEACARERRLENLRVITRDVNLLQLEETFDRIVSIEMFEHMRNYKKLLAKVASWLKPDGFLFVHIFCHKEYAYEFTADKKEDWMGRYFFTGGMMPSFDLFDFFREDLNVEEKWFVDGRHYEKTSNAWLEKMDHAHDRLKPVVQQVYGEASEKWWAYWRIFFMACAELFGFESGAQWGVGHYLLRKKKP